MPHSSLMRVKPRGHEGTTILFGDFNHSVAYRNQSIPRRASRKRLDVKIACVGEVFHQHDIRVHESFQRRNKILQRRGKRAADLHRPALGLTANVTAVPFNVTVESFGFAPNAIFPVARGAIASMASSRRDCAAALNLAM
jgi:hypothetical protein